MALKLTVKPGESFFVGTAEITVQCDAIVNVLVVRPPFCVPKTMFRTPTSVPPLSACAMLCSRCI